jgi:flagellar motor switch protein FliG
MSEENAILSKFSGSQKSAILVMYLNREVARLLLTRLTDDEVRLIGLAMASIEKVSPDEVEEVVRDFLEELVDTALISNSGPDFVKSVLPDLIDESRRTDILPQINRRVNRDFELFIRNRKPRAVAALLKDEHPQVQAVALALMGDDNASRVMRFMEQTRQAEITMRMSRLQQIPGDLADDVMNSIREGLGVADDYMEIGGIDRTARILGRMSRTLHEPILGAVEDEDDALAQRLRRRMVVFEDLIILNKRDIQTLIKQVQKEDLRVALKGADPQMRELFFSGMSKRQAADYREELEIMAQPQRSLIRQSQESIVAEAVKLRDDGLITLAVGAEEDEEEEV